MITPIIKEIALITPTIVIFLVIQSFIYWISFPPVLDYNPITPFYSLSVYYGVAGTGSWFGFLFLRGVCEQKKYQTNHFPAHKSQHLLNPASRT